MEVQKHLFLAKNGLPGTDVCSRKMWQHSQNPGHGHGFHPVHDRSIKRVEDTIIGVYPIIVKALFKNHDHSDNC